MRTTPLEDLGSVLLVIPAPGGLTLSPGLCGGLPPLIYTVFTIHTNTHTYKMNLKKIK